MSVPERITDESARKRAIGTVLGEEGGLASAGMAAHAVRQYEEFCGVRCDVLMPQPNDANTPVVLMVFPGRMGLLFFAAPRTPTSCHQLGTFLRQIGPCYRGQGLVILQSLTEIGDEARAEVLLAANFRLVTTLIYLERGTRYPWFDPPAATDARWRSYSASDAALFSATLRATYCGTLDCPELSGVRSDADILAAHQSSGVFLPDCWELAEIDGQLAGCILLNRVIGSRAFEVAYVGVVPAFRGRGVGRLLMLRALERARSGGAQQLTLAVDVRNVPARKLYENMGFRAITSRQAYLRFLAGEPSDFNSDCTSHCG